MNRINKKFNSVEVFSGCGGLTLGMKKAGFKTKVAVELDEDAIKAFKLNHKKTVVIPKDIKEVKSSEITELLNGKVIHCGDVIRKKMLGIRETA
jgi:DNA (cytosine-5)-methyltransferase 1